MTVIEQSYSSRVVTARLGILAAGLFVVGTNAFVIAGLLPDIARTLHVSVQHVSYSITLYAIVVAVASPALSIALARVDRSHLMAGGLAAIAIGTAITTVAGTIEVFDAGRLVAAVGGAALVPAATAAAPALLPPEQRGRALAIAGLGFTLATAVGSPVGTALADVGSWRLPLGCLAAMAALLAVAVVVFVRDIPLGAAAGLAARFSALRRGATIAALIAAMLLTTAFNVVYIFSAAVTAPATGGSGTLLAVLLLVYGLGGVIGTTAAGRVTDRLGSRTTVAVTLGAELVLFALMPLVDRSIVALGAVFLLWGVAAFAAVIPVQHRLVEIDPAAAGIALSWYSTAMYVGIALAPIIGAVALGGSAGQGSGASTIPLLGAGLAALALGTFLLGFVRWSPSR